MSKTQRIQKISVWDGILEENIISPLVCRENLSGDVYQKMLQGTIDLLTTQVIENSVECLDKQLISEDKEIFQHNG